MKNSINVVGLVYIGIPTSLMFSSVGLTVHGTDINKITIEKLSKHLLPIEEEGLNDLFKNSLRNGITFSSEITKADFYIIAVPTPYLSKSKTVDATYIVNATKSLLGKTNEDSIIIIESTVSPGTIKKFIEPLVDEFNFKNKTRLRLAHAPERIIPGNMVYELKTNSRTIGADDLEVLEKVASIYSKITSGKIVKTSIYNAELTKVVENTFRAVNIAFSNELLKLGSYYNFDPYEVINICNLHPRVKILNPGPGVGGHCIPIDPWFLVGDWPLHTELIKLALEINEGMPEFVLKHINKIKRIHNISDNGKVGIYGLTYKENVDDIRESPSLQLLSLIEHGLGGHLKSFDPTLKKHYVKGQVLNFDQFMNGLDFVIVMVKHSHLKLNLELFKNKIILDTHNYISPQFTKVRYLLSDSLE
jgi:UDP-N-acetyl-D-mannosaminuronic acid dehydrogenase